jgi:hypothetical protein
MYLIRRCHGGATKITSVEGEFADQLPLASDVLGQLVLAAEVEVEDAAVDPPLDALQPSGLLPAAEIEEAPAPAARLHERVRFGQGSVEPVQRRLARRRDGAGRQEVIQAPDAGGEVPAISAIMPRSRLRRQDQLHERDHRAQHAQRLAHHHVHESVDRPSLA